jgi:hypothetical protein
MIFVYDVIFYLISLLVYANDGNVLEEDSCLERKT